MLDKPKILPKPEPKSVLYTALFLPSYLQKQRKEISSPSALSNNAPNTFWYKFSGIIIPHHQHSAYHEKPSRNFISRIMTKRERERPQEGRKKSDHDDILTRNK
jgi:hypothetical protein